jgi:hypothetical protein
VNCHEIESTIIFYVAAFGDLGSSPDFIAEQHVASRFGLGSNDPEQPSRGKLPDFYAQQFTRHRAQRSARNTKYKSGDARDCAAVASNLVTNAGCVSVQSRNNRANHPGNCS